MPITKKQSEVPGVSSEEFEKEELAAQEEKRAKEIQAEEEGNIAQVSSAALHNYPDAKIPHPEPPPEEKKTPQPRTGAAATAKEE